MDMHKLSNLCLWGYVVRLRRHVFGIKRFVAEGFPALQRIADLITTDGVLS